MPHLPACTGLGGSLSGMGMGMSLGMGMGADMGLGLGLGGLGMGNGLEQHGLFYVCVSARRAI